MLGARTLVAAICLSLGLPGMAEDRKSVLDLEEPLEIPGTVLKPGKYVLRLEAEPQEQFVSQILNLVEVLDEAEARVVAKIYTLPSYNPPPEGKPLFTYYDREPGRPKALNTWFHPSVNYGERFVYPTEQAAEIGTTAKQTVVSMPLTQIAPPAAAPPKARTKLPKAAGYLPIAAWAGLATLVGFFLFRIYRRDPADSLHARNWALAQKVAAAAYQNYKMTRRASTGIRS
jgi:hypothetical protein